MRNRAKPSPPETPTATPTPAEPEPTKLTKYDELVDVLAEGLFEVMTEPAPWSLAQRTGCSRLARRSRGPG